MPVIATIGYEGTDADGLVAALQAAGIRRLADIRAVANSRNKAFCKRALAARLDAAGIAYTHLPALGTPKPGRDAARSGDVDVFQAIFAAQLATDEAQAALAALAGTAAAEPSCLLCLEREPARCHRAIVADRLAERGFAVQHLFAAG